MWLGVMVAVSRGDAYQAARFVCDAAGEWPKIEHYDARKGQHRGLQLEPPFVRSRDEAAALAEDARADAKQFPAIRHWLEMFADRLEAEANFSMTRMARLMR